MPFAFIIFGALLLTAGARGQSSNLVTLVKGDLTGKNNFIYWIVSILLIGSIGYIEDFKALSRAFLVLVLVVLVLANDKGSNGGFFVKFQQAIDQISGSASK